MKTTTLFLILCVLSAVIPGCISRQPLTHHQIATRELARLPEALRESSGLAQHQGLLWTINDSGGSAVIFGINSQGGIQERINISNAENIDWESMAQDESYLYIADTGNNFNRRDRFTIYRVPWDQIASGEAAADLITLEYGDHVPGTSRKHNFDSEALAVRGNELWLLSKDHGSSVAKLYRFPRKPGDYKVFPSQRIPFEAQITAADIHPESGELVILAYHEGEGNYIARMPTSEKGILWSRAKMARITPTDQWEAIIWDRANNRQFLLTHEDNEQGYPGLASLSIQQVTANATLTPDSSAAPPAQVEKRLEEQPRKKSDLN